VVRYSIKDLLDVNDIHHVDLLLSIATQALISVGEERLVSSQRLADKAKALAAQLQGLMAVEQEKTEAHKDGAGAEVTATLGVWGFLSSKLFLRYQYEKQTRDKIREKYRANITEFLDLIDSLLLELRSQVGKPILILIDDTDKIPPKKGLELFYANGHHLAHPKADILFVVDLSLATSSRYPAIRAKFSGEEFFPAIKIRDKFGRIADSCLPARAMLAELTGKRIPSGGIEADALEQAIDACGGVVRELIRYRQGEANHLGNIGLIHQARGDLDAALAAHQEALEIHRDIGYRQGEAIHLGNIGQIHQDRGDLRAALDAHQEALEIDRTIGYRQGMANQLGNIGVILQARGDLNAALTVLEEALKIDRAIGYREGEAADLGSIGLIHRDRGDLDAALTTLEESLEIDRAIGYHHGEANQLGNIGLIHRDRGDLDAALAAHEEALEIDRAIGYRQGEAADLVNIGTIHEQRGDRETARNYYADALEIYTAMGLEKERERLEQKLE